MSDSTFINGVPAEVWNETKVPLLIGICVFFIVLTVLTIALRFYARRKRRQPFQTDDWLTVPGLILIFGLASIIFYGLSTHTLGYPSPEMEITSSNWTIVTARTVSIATTLTLYT